MHAFVCDSKYHHERDRIAIVIIRRGAHEKSLRQKKKKQLFADHAVQRNALPLLSSSSLIIHSFERLRRRRRRRRRRRQGQRRQQHTTTQQQLATSADIYSTCRRSVDYSSYNASSNMTDAGDIGKNNNKSRNSNDNISTNKENLTTSTTFFDAVAPPPKSSASASNSSNNITVTPTTTTKTKTLKRKLPSSSSSSGDTTIHVDDNDDDDRIYDPICASTSGSSTTNTSAPTTTVHQALITKKTVTSLTTTTSSPVTTVTTTSKKPGAVKMVANYGSSSNNNNNNNDKENDNYKNSSTSSSSNNDISSSSSKTSNVNANTNSNDKRTAASSSVKRTQTASTSTVRRTSTSESGVTQIRQSNLKQGDNDNNSNKNRQRPKPPPLPSSLIQLSRKDKKALDYFTAWHSYITELHNTFSYDVEKWKQRATQYQNELEELKLKKLKDVATATTSTATTKKKEPTTGIEQYDDSAAAAVGFDLELSSSSESESEDKNEKRDNRLRDGNTNQKNQPSSTTTTTAASTTAMENDDTDDDEDKDDDDGLMFGSITNDYDDNVTDDDEDEDDDDGLMFGSITNDYDDNVTDDDDDDDVEDDDDDGMMFGSITNDYDDNDTDDNVTDDVEDDDDDDGLMFGSITNDYDDDDDDEDDVDGMMFGSITAASTNNKSKDNKNLPPPIRDVDDDADDNDDDGNADEIRYEDDKKASITRSLADYDASADEIRSCENFFKDDPTNLQDRNNLRSTMVHEMERIKPILIDKYPELLGIVNCRLDDHQDFKWLLQPMEVMVSGRPISKGINGLKKALMVGNYPKPTLCKRDNDLTGLKGMFEKVKEEEINSESRFRNVSMDQLRSTFGEIGQNESESITCEGVEEAFVAVDIFPFQLFYNADVPKLLDVFKEEFSTFYGSYIAYTKFEFESVAKALSRAGQDPTKTPLFTLGSAPYKEITKYGRHLHFLVGLFKYPVQTCHPCSLIDATRTCGLKNLIQCDETLTHISRFITGNKKMVITYHKRFYDKNEAVVQAVKKRRSRTSLGGPDESELQKRSRKRKKSEHENRSRKRTKFGKTNDELWSDKFNLAVQYVTDSGKIPKSVPAHLSKKKMIALSTKEQSEKTIIMWTIKERKRYTGTLACRNHPFAEWKKEKLRDSGLLLDNHLELWDYYSNNPKPLLDY